MSMRKSCIFAEISNSNQHIWFIMLYIFVTFNIYWDINDYKVHFIRLSKHYFSPISESEKLLIEDKENVSSNPIVVAEVR